MFTRYDKSNLNRVFHIEFRLNNRYLYLIDYISIINFIIKLKFENLKIKHLFSESTIFIFTICVYIFVVHISSRFDRKKLYNLGKIDIKFNFLLSGHLTIRNIFFLRYKYFTVGILLQRNGSFEVFVQVLILFGLAFFLLSFSSKGDNDVILVAVFLASPYGIPEAY